MRFLLFAAIAALSAGPAAAQEADGFLSRFAGPWTAEGHVMGEKVRYCAEGAFVFGGAFLELRITDAAEPPQYDASVFIGRSEAKGDYVAHWLDVFGADGARVVGTGDASGDVLTLVFPYETSVFHDRFEFEGPGAFRLLIEADEDGRRSVFADYAFRRGSCSAA